MTGTQTKSDGRLLWTPRWTPRWTPHWTPRCTRRAAAALLLLLAIGLAPSADAKKLWKNKWRITVAAPVSPSGNHFGVRTYIIRARRYDEPPSPLPLRKLTATLNGADVELEGVWRQSGKSFSLTFELRCEPQTVCGTVILRGRFTSRTEMSGRATLMWDTRDRDNVAGFETVNGSFEGAQE